MAMRFMTHHERELKWLLVQCDSDVQVSLERSLRSLDLPAGKVENLIGELSSCNCCARHLGYCPPCLLPGDDLPKTPDDLKTPDKDKEKCQCKCRHYARILCRTYGHLSELHDYTDYTDYQRPILQPILQPIPPLKMSVPSIMN